MPRKSWVADLRPHLRRALEKLPIRRSSISTRHSFGWQRILLGPAAMSALALRLGAKPDPDRHPFEAIRRRGDRRGLRKVMEALADKAGGLEPNRPDSASCNIGHLPIIGNQLADHWLPRSTL